MAKAPADLVATPTPSIQIVSRKPGFRRGGIAHPTGPETYPAGTFTEEQLEQILAEPNLIVTEPPATAAARAA